MKSRFMLILCFFYISFQLTANAQERSLWKMVFEDEFNSESFDTNYWSYCTRANPDWAKYLTSSPATVNNADGFLKLRLIKNTNTSVDNVPYLSGGIQTKSKFNFKYGKVEVRAKFSNGQGSWPAIWMMPEDASAGWPACGEIDIMEHVNSEDRIHQTIHSDFSNTQGIKNPNPTQTTAFDKNAFNVYGVEWHPDRLDFTLNGKLTFSYPRINTTKTGQWPFDKPFYIILNMAGGGSWTGAITETALPFEMQVDWVRVYERDPEGPYIVPGWTSNKSQNNTQNDSYWANTFVKKITTTGALNNLNYETSQRPESYYYEHADTLNVTENSSVSFDLTANSLGDYTTSTVLQDLRYTCNYVYADLDGDKRFETSLERVGNVPPTNGVGGNFNVMNISRTLNIPQNSSGRTGRVRIIYDNAWAERFSSEINVREGVVYDFPIRIIQKNTAVEQIQFKPAIYRNGECIISENIDGNYKVELFNAGGQCLQVDHFRDTNFRIKAPKGFVYVRITNSLGYSFSYKL